MRVVSIENHIRKGETFKIPSGIQPGERQGMMLLDEYLRQLVADKKITPKVAIDASQDPREMEQRLLGGAS